MATDEELTTAVLEQRDRWYFAVIRVLLISLFALFVANVIGSIAVKGQHHPVVNIVLPLASVWVGCAALWIAVFRLGRARIDVIFFTLAWSCYALEETLYWITADASKGPAGENSAFYDFPSIGILLNLLFVLFLVASMVALVRNRKKGEPAFRLLLLDSAVAALGTATLLAALLSPSIEKSLYGGSPLLDNIEALLSYFVTIIVVAGFVGATVLPNLQVGQRWNWLVASLLVFAAGIVIQSLIALLGIDILGTFEPVWALGLLFLVVWATGQERTFHSTPRTRPVFVAAPSLSVLVGLTVLVLATQVHISIVAIVLATLTVGGAAVPMVLRQVVLARLVEGQAAVVHQLEDLDRAKTELMSTINHELRTPLTSIRGYIELLSEGYGGPITEEGQKMLGVVDHNADRLANLVNDMLIMSGLDAHSAGLVAGPVDIGRLLDTIELSLQPFARSRNVSLLIHSGQAQAIVMGDVQQLERALTNVIHNAIKFTPEAGSVSVELEVEDHCVVVRVIDTGIGIPEKEVAQLFSRFFRASNARSGAVPGTGLGLAIVRAIVEDHDGQISVVSTEGKGTAVRVELPRCDAIESM